MSKEDKIKERFKVPEGGVNLNPIFSYLFNYERLATLKTDAEREAHWKEVFDALDEVEKERGKPIDFVDLQERLMRKLEDAKNTAEREFENS